jgi:hypothetical protein
MCPDCFVTYVPGLYPRAVFEYADEDEDEDEDGYGDDGERPDLATPARR